VSEQAQRLRARWRRVVTLVRREMRATLRNPFTVTVLVMVPIVALVMFGFVLSTEVKGLGLAVHDASNTAESRRLIADLAANGTFRVRHYRTREEIERALVGGAASVALIVPPDFGRRLQAGRRGGPPPAVQVIYDGGEAVQAGNAEGAMRTILAASGVTLVGERRPTRAAGEGVEVASRALFNPRLDGVRFMVAGTFGFVLSFLTTVITAVSIVNERVGGTFEQLQVTPATSVEILLGKILPLGAIFAFDVCLMVLVGGLVLGVWPAGSVPFFLVVSSFYVLVSLALGLIFSATSATAGEAVQKTVLFSIPLVQMSGFAFPIRNMPAVFQWIAELFPATHYIRICRAIYLRAEGPLALVPELCVLFLFGTVLIALAIRSIEARS
jgi:ABC-2 type transport system permease protein